MELEQQKIIFCLYVFRLIRRTRTKFFSGGTLLWDENSSAGKYVRENCKEESTTIANAIRISLNQLVPCPVYILGLNNFAVRINTMLKA